MITTGHNKLLYGLLGVVGFLGLVGITASVVNAAEAPYTYQISKAEQGLMDKFQQLNLGLIRNVQTGKMTLIGKATKEQVCGVVHQFPEVKVTTVSIVHGGQLVDSFTCS